MLLTLSLPPDPRPLLGLLWAVPLTLALLHLPSGAPGFRSAVGMGALFGGVHALLLLHWLPAAGVPLLGPGTALLAGVSVWTLNAALVAVVLGAVHRLRGPGRLGSQAIPRIPVPISLAAGWVVLGWLPAAIPALGFPWLGPEASLVETPSLLASSAWIGGAGVAGLLVFSGAALGVVLEKPGSGSAGQGSGRRVRWLVAAFLPWGVMWALMSLGPAAREDGAGADGPLLRVAALSVEADPPLLLDAQARTGILMERLDALTSLLAPGEVELVLWPESPTGTSHPSVEPAVARRWSQALGAPVFVGALEGPERRNQVLAADPAGGLGLVREKRRLVPLVEGWNPGMVWRSPGVFVLPVSPAGPAEGAPSGGTDVTLGALICFEVLFGDEGRALRRDGARILLLPSNEGWLAEVGVADAARRQHRAAAVLRARELAVPVVRSAVGGPAGIWDAGGREVTGEVRTIPAVGSVVLATVEVGPAAIPPGSSGVAGTVALAGFLLLLAAVAPRSAATAAASGAGTYGSRRPRTPGAG